MSRLSPATSTGECDFNRVAIRPGGREFLVWADRRPWFHNYDAYRYPSSTVGWARRQTPASFFTLDGEVSALNWASNGSSAEFLVDGRDIADLQPESGSLISRPAGSGPTVFVWRAIGVKNLRWGGLSALISDRAFADSLPRGASNLFHRAGFILAAERREYHELAPQDGPTPTSTPDEWYPEARYSAAGPLPPALNRILPARPLFDTASGRSVGWQDALGTYRADGRRLPTAHAPAGALLRDSVSLGVLRASLYARPDGSHWLAVEDGSGGWSKLLCGPDLKNFRTRFAVITIGKVRYPVLLESFGGPQRRAFVRFHGGPFSSVLDDYPSNEARRVALAGGTLVEFDWPGSRGKKSASPRVDPQTVRAFDTALWRWLRARGFTSEIVSGDSFGAIGAVDFALADPRAVRKLVLMVPLTSFDPKLNLVGQPLQEGSLDARTEQVILGDDRDRRVFAAWLDRSVGRACATLPLTVLVGGKDDKTPLARQAPCAAKRSIVFKDATHSSLQQDDAAWAWLSDSAKDLPAVPAAKDADVRGPVRPG